MPLVPSTAEGGVDCPPELSPQQTTAPVPRWIAQLWDGAAAIAEAVPSGPCTDEGGGAGPPPQQTTALVPAWIAQVCDTPAAIAEAVPSVPSTLGGGVAGPCTKAGLAQQTTAPVPAWIAQL